MLGMSHSPLKTSNAQMAKSLAGTSSSFTHYKEIEMKSEKSHDETFSIHMTKRVKLATYEMTFFFSAYEFVHRSQRHTSSILHISLLLFLRFIHPLYLTTLFSSLLFSTLLFSWEPLRVPLLKLKEKSRQTHIHKDSQKHPHTVSQIHSQTDRQTLKIHSYLAIP